MSAASDASPFRGYRALDEVRANCQRLVDAMALCGKPAAAIWLRPHEYDLIVRWPKASSVHGFSVDSGVVRFGGRLVKRGAGPGRYDDSPR